MVLVDDCSTDRTVDVARELGLEPVLHESNKGYGGNQKTCYRQAIDSGADIVVMVHPDYQYSPLLVPAMAAMIAYGEYDMVLGSRILAQNSVARGMPRYKYVANRFLTFVENVALNQKLSEYHTGLRAFSSELLAGLPFERNSDDFVFDNHIIAQAVAAGARIGEVSCPTRYEAESSSINLKRSIKYGFGVLNTCKDYRLNKHGLRTRDYLDFEPGKIAPSAPFAGVGQAAPGQVTEPEAEVAAESRQLNGKHAGRRGVTTSRNISVDLENAVTPEDKKGRHHLSIASLGLVLVSVLAAAGGQLMLKHGMQIATNKQKHAGGSLVIGAATSPWVWLGLAVFGISAIVWLVVLSRVPLSLAYPFNALGYLVILTASIVLLHERANLFTWAGTTLVVAGLVIVVLSKP